MTDTKLIASLFDRLNQNQLALGATEEELSNRVEQRGSRRHCEQRARRAGNARREPGIHSLGHY